MVARSTDISDTPPIPHPLEGTSSRIVSDATPQPGAGKAAFRQIADHSADMVKAGKLGHVSFVDSRQGGTVESDIDPKHRAEFRRDIANTADQIVSGKDPQLALSNGVQDFFKHNPGGDPSIFGRMLQSAFDHNPKAKSLQSIFTSNSLVVRDRKAVSDANPGGVVAAVPTVPTDTPEGKSEVASFDAARELLKFGRPIGLNGDGPFGEALRDMKYSGELAGVPNLPPRVRPGSPVPLEQQKQELNKQFDGKISDSTLTDALGKADQLAFATSGGKFGASFAQSLDSLVKSGLDKRTAIDLLASGLNVVTKSQDFSLSTVGSEIDVTNVNDKRLATPANPNGATGGILTGQLRSDDGAEVASEFKAAQQAGSILNRFGARHGPKVSRKDFEKFLDSSVGNLNELRFDAF